MARDQDQSAAFHLLDERIQRFIWSEGWQALREAQEEAIPLIVRGDADVVIAAPTAAGKTEAAFFPALTRLLAQTPPGLIVYISPLKALINDQFGRLERLCEELEVLVCPWHGDISNSRRIRFLHNPQGVLLITPESLEAFFCRRGSVVGSVFARTLFLVIDELHAFIGSERGKQLQSLLHRLETAIGRQVPRIGLSATLGDMTLAGEFLRPSGSPALVESQGEGGELRVLLKGYTEAKAQPGAAERPPAERIAADIFRTLHQSNNLVFPNSRREVERFTHLLNGRCERDGIPTRFWPHHGNLSREIRSETEWALKQKDHPATAVCTNTLELGIDIGAVRSVAQIGPPPSVASLRQRLGRSGRRPGEPAILRGYCVEAQLSDAVSLRDRLRLNTVQTAAMVALLVERWVEPPRIHGAHFSTLVQQVLSATAQFGAVKAAQLYRLLCAPAAAFSAVSKAEFADLLRALVENDYLMQDSTGDLLLGQRGEREVNNKDFYAAFTSDEEFKVTTQTRVLGTLPVGQALTVGQRILFGGQTWEIVEIDSPGKTIHVVQAKGGTPPMFSGGAGRTHTRVRQRMREILRGAVTAQFLDETAAQLVHEGCREYARMGLDQKVLVDAGDSVILLTWLGDSANEAIACLFLRQGITASASGPGVEIRRRLAEAPEVLQVLAEAAAGEAPRPELLAANIPNLTREKWDQTLPEGLLQKGYASHYLDVDEALEWIRSTIAKYYHL